MARILGINIPDNKRIEIALTYIYGIGKFSANSILKKVNIDPDRKTKDLSGKEIEQIKNIVENDHKVEGDLRMEVSQNIKRLKEINAWRGIRHSKKLPSRGQRTKTNARTKRGRRVCVGSGRRPTAEKT